MRAAILLLVLTLGLLPVAPVTASDWGASAIGATSVSADATQQPPKDLNVDIDINKGGGGVWYANPVWIGLGVLALVILVLLVVMATRGGGGTTVVRD